MKQKKIIVIFILFLAVFSSGTICMPDREFSPMENRNLAKAPSFSVKNLTSGQFGTDMETYLSDQVFGKDLLVTLKNDVEWFLGKRKLGEVYISQNGEYISGYAEDKEQIRKNTEEVNGWVQRLPDSVPVTCFLVPDRIAFDADSLPGPHWEDSQEETIAGIQKALDPRISFVDVTGALKAHLEEKLYFETDHHWTMLGAYYGYCALSQELGLQALPLSDYERRIISDDFQGSLYSKAPVSFAARDEMEYFQNPKGQYRITFVKEEKETDQFLVEEQLEKKDKYAAFLGGNYGEVQVESNAAHKENILVLKDSYANIMLPFLADSASNLYVLDLRYYTGDAAAYVEEHNIDQVVLCYNVDFWNTDNHFIRLN